MLRQWAPKSKEVQGLELQGALMHCVSSEVHKDLEAAPML